MTRKAVAVLAGLSLLTALPPPPFAVAATQDGDGEATPAACAPFGFNVPSTDDDGIVVVSGHRAAVPPPVTLPIAPTKKEDRVQYAPTPLVTVQREQLLESGQGTTVDYLATVPAMSNSVVPPGSPPPPPVVRPPGPPVQGEPERYPDATPNPVRRTSEQPVSTFSIDVDTAAYANVRRFVRDGTTPPRDAVRVEEMVNYFTYDLPRPASAAEPFAVSTSLVASPWAEGRQVLHVALTGYELPAAQRRPLNLTFLVDVSGSMSSPDKLGLAQRSMNLVIDRMRPGDTIAVTTYASGARVLLAPTPGTQKLKLRCAVASLSSGGGTAGAAGMVNAYQQAEAAFGRDKVNRILMFTDGDFNVGVTEDKSLEDYVAGKRQTRIYLSAYGFGRGNYQDARMQAISQAGNGTAAYVDDLDEARRLFGPLFDRGAFPIADDVKIQVEFNPARVSEWRLIGYETRLLNEADFANDRIDAGEVGSGATVVALYEITPVGGPSWMPERRYETATPAGDPSGEWAFVQVRYKLPGQPNSILMQHPVTTIDGSPGTEVRWALAVAGAAQLLRADPWMAPDFGWDRVIDLAQGARGDDPWGERAQFVQIARAAEGLPPRRTP
ncbi:MAG: von Willebrand factor type A domain-containing protein [Alphaproteobacteria bacterium]|nr:von Willebrand factor type A domain-containing protein [Alphaproteobacteria bacterium]MBU1527128.1 von Willebrand factor type A domain-containing protein [Alphaproteobacteria bacterium]MBU2350676.1 von Willebrand factor type A domain-containing protein [Alphaproteobacteria bacterium]MBU2383293.1 von Willebrand factor type A domain-containing protein [Alphaproteobacteria bacterium]